MEGFRRYERHSMLVIHLPVVVGADFEQLAKALLALAQLALALDLCRDVSRDPAISQKRAVLVEEGRSAGIDPNDFAVRQLSPVDEVAVGLLRLDRGQARSRGLR